MDHKHPYGLYLPFNRPGVPWAVFTHSIVNNGLPPEKFINGLKVSHGKVGLIRDSELNFVKG